MYKEEIFSFKKNAVDFLIDKEEDGYTAFIEECIFNDGSKFYIVGYFR